MTLLEGGPEPGKTILALQTLVNGARKENEPGIFVAFVESFGRIAADAARFGWDLSGEHSVAVRAICSHVIGPFVPKSFKANFVLEVKWAGINS
jgi:KaiC/GvpD/RAD55 family RecA-like ATPase